VSEPVLQPQVDYAALAAQLRSAEGSGGRGQLINELLLDVRGWRTQPEDEIAARLSADPLAAAAAWELTAAASELSAGHQSDSQFLRPFRRADFLRYMLYLGVVGAPDPPPELPRTSVLVRRSPWDALRLLHDVLRWARRFAHWPVGDRRALLRINLQHLFAVAVLGEPESPAEAVLHAALESVGIRTIAFDPAVPEHHLGAWLAERLGLRQERARVKQQQLDFREAGTTENSLFVVRAMGGVDGCDVRGSIGEDLGLIIDIGDREVSVPATAYLERHVAAVINERTPLSAELADRRLVLRWYDTRLTPEELGQIIYEALKAQFTLSVVSVNLLFDPIRIASLRPSVYAYCEERIKELERRSDEREPFVLCRSCASYAPHAFCVVSVDRPPCCHRCYDELAALAQFTPSTAQLTIERGVCRDRTRGRYMGSDKAAQLLSEGAVEAICLHSLHESPHPTTALAQCIAWYLEELDVICVLSADYSGRSPDGKTFDTLLARVAGRQTPGYIGVSEAYLASPRFLADEGGISRVGWMNSALKERLQLRADHVATEKDCINLAGLKEFLATWRH